MRGPRAATRTGTGAALGSRCPRVAPGKGGRSHVSGATSATTTADLPLGASTRVCTSQHACAHANTRVCTGPRAPRMEQRRTKAVPRPPQQLRTSWGFLSPRKTRAEIPSCPEPPFLITVIAAASSPPGPAYSPGARGGGRRDLADPPGDAAVGSAPKPRRQYRAGGPQCPPMSLSPCWGHLRPHSRCGAQAASALLAPGGHKGCRRGGEEGAGAAWGRTNKEEKATEEGAAARGSRRNIGQLL